MIRLHPIVATRAGEQILSNSLTRSPGEILNACKPGAMLVALMLLFAMLVVPPILINAEGPAALAEDMIVAHLPQINFFIEHPSNVLDYPGAVTSLPGHHLLLAWAARLLGYNVIDSTTWAIRLIHAIACGVGAIGLFLFLLRMQYCQHKSKNVLMAAALWISVVFSYYFIQSSIYVSTDVPAISLYMMFIYVVIFHSRSITAPMITGTALVLCRQNYAPVLATPFLVKPHEIFSRLLSPQIVTLIVPALVFLAYILKFGGLVPAQSWAESSRDIGSLFPQSVLHTLAYLGLILPVYLLLFADEMRVCYGSRISMRAALTLVILVVVLWTLQPSNYDVDSGRWGSIVWTLSTFGPQWGNRSALVLFLAALGSLFTVFLGWLAAHYWEVRPVVFGMLLYLAFEMIVPLAYQRYIEPIILLSLALIAARCVTVSRRRVVLFAMAFGSYGVVGILRIYNIVPWAGVIS
jgi:hypothetical protein